MFNLKFPAHAEVSSTRGYRFHNSIVKERDNKATASIGIYAEEEEAGDALKEEIALGVS